MNLLANTWRDKFLPLDLGKTVATRGVEALTKSEDGEDVALTLNGLAVGNMLVRHRNGDWGETCKEDAALNDRSLRDGDERGRIMSTYRLEDDTRIWIITEWDRSVTTILLPEEY